MHCSARCSPLRWLVGPALLVLLVSAGLEAEGLGRSEDARHTLRRELRDALTLRSSNEVQGVQDEALRAVDVRQDASAAAALTAYAEAHPSAQAWHFASLAITWDGERERAAAKAASSAARLAPGDAAMAQAEETALDGLMWAEIREVSRPASAIAGGVVGLALLGWLGRRAHARGRHRWIDGLRVRVIAAGDGVPAAAGSDLVVTPETTGLALDVFLYGPGPFPARHGPTLSVVLSHGRDSRTVRLTPVKDARQDAIRVRLSETSLAEVLAHPGRWRVAVLVDGRHVGEAGLLVTAGQRVGAGR